MANPKHLAILKQGGDVWNQWRGENINTAPDLRGTNLTKANLGLADLRGADLARALLDSSTQMDEKWRLVWEICLLYTSRCV